MDDRGFIFTADATLALIVFIVFTASIVTYYMLPFFMGEDHQHLEALASDALDVMQQDGTLYTAAGKYASNNSSGAESILRTELNTLIPSNIAYKITIGSNPGNSVEDNKNITSFTLSRDSATAVRVLSGPNETWLGRAYYENNSAFTTLNYDNDVTLWDFHNWLTNYGPWSNTLFKFPFWGYNAGAVVPISFSVPNDAILTRGSFLVGSGSPTAVSNGANFILNGFSHNIKTSVEPAPNFKFVYKRTDPGLNTIANVYNYYNGSINLNELHNGANAFQFGNSSIPLNGFTNVSTNARFSLPWFSLIGSYRTSIQAPSGTVNTRYNFTDAGGLAVPNPNGSLNLTQYDLKTGNTVNSTSSTSKMDWNSFTANKNTLDTFSTGSPFLIYNVPGGVNNTTAVSRTQDVIIPSGVRILDGYVNLNAYGGTDNVLVEVWNGTSWNTAFCSFNFDGKSYSARSDGYGNIPGVIYIGSYLKTGNNKVRVTVMDNYKDLRMDLVNPDYELVGMVDSYTTVTTSNLPVRWETFPFNSYQAPETSSEYTSPQKSISIGTDAKNVYMFVGVGLNSRHLKVEVKNSTSTVWNTLYNDDNIPFSIDLANKDINGPKSFTTGTAGNYTIIPGTYNVRVSVTAPNKNWDSGDGGLIPPGDAVTPGAANPAIFSGTRVTVLYPTQTISAVAYDNNPNNAQINARQKLINLFSQMGITINPSDIKTEAIFTGNSLKGIPVRLDLWRE